MTEHQGKKGEQLMNINGYEIKSGADLRKADLTDADLENADLSYADLEGANLYGANLTGTILEFAHFVDGKVQDYKILTKGEQ